MYKQQEGSGNFEIEVEYNSGVLIIRRILDRQLKTILEKGFKGNFILNAKYKIIDGVLFLTGGVTASYFVAKDHWGDTPFDDQKEIPNLIEKLYIGTDNIVTTTHRKWFGFGEEYTKRVILPGHYLIRREIPKEYKTSTFRIIENE